MMKRRLFLVPLILLLAASPPLIAVQEEKGDALHPQTSGSVTVPVDTIIRLRLTQGLSSRTAQKGDTFTAKVVSPVVVGETVAIPEGSIVYGRVTSVARAARRRDGRIAVTFYRLELPSQQTFTIYGSLASVETEEGKKQEVGKEGEVSGKSGIKRDVVFIGGGAGVGAVIGAAAGGGKGAGIGAAVGAGIGAAGALLRKGSEVELASGTEFSMVLDRAVTLPTRR
ncbi:MAG TPA: hypothetical protein VNM72_09500 [Blastocatellia bacterium]|nr:hypothetical protein [Blastocatellia bacterium]